MEKREPKPFKLLPRHLHLTSTPMGVFRWRCNPPKEVTVGDLLKPVCWETVSEKFSVREPHHQGQIVEVLPEGDEWYAEIIVFRMRNGQLSIKHLKTWSFGDVNPEISEGDFEVKWRGAKKWSVVRKVDQHIIQENMDKEEAYKALEDYIKAA